MQKTCIRNHGDNLWVTFLIFYIYILNVLMRIIVDSFLFQIHINSFMATCVLECEV